MVALLKAASLRNPQSVPARCLAFSVVGSEWRGRPGAASVQRPPQATSIEPLSVLAHPSMGATPTSPYPVGIYAPLEHLVSEMSAQVPSPAANQRPPSPSLQHLVR